MRRYNTQPSYAKATEGHSETLACASEAQQSEGVKATVGIYPRLNRNKIKAEWYITLQAGKRVVRKFDNYNNMVWYIIGIHENIGIYFLGIVSKKKRGGNKKDRRRRPATDEWSDGKYSYAITTVILYFASILSLEIIGTFSTSACAANNLSKGSV